MQAAFAFATHVAEIGVKSFMQALSLGDKGGRLEI